MSENEKVAKCAKCGNEESNWRHGASGTHAFTPAPATCEHKRIEVSPDNKNEWWCKDCRRYNPEPSKPAEAGCKTCGATMRGTYCPACYDPGKPAEAAMSEELDENDTDHHVSCRHCGVGINVRCDREEWNAEAAALRQSEQALRDAGEMLWVVLANVSGGDWTKQTQEWQDAAARWRDNYFAAAAALRGVKK